MEVIAICQEMGWDYYKYMSQPKWFVRLLSEKLDIDSSNIKKQLNKK